MLSKLTFVVLLSLLVAMSPAFGQMTINQSDFDFSIGAIFYGAQNAAVDTNLWYNYVGGSGGGHVWDFTMIPFPQTFQSRVVNTNVVPLNNLFPSATAAWESVPTWSPFSNSSNQLLNYGTISIGQYDLDPEIDTFTRIFDPPSLQYQFPINSGSSWVTLSLWSQDYGTFSTTTRDSTRWVVDAWGTMKYGSNQVEVLRVRGERVSKNTTTYISGPPSTSTNSSLTLQFLPKSEYSGFTMTRSVGGGNQVYVGLSGDSRFVSGATPVYEIPNSTLPVEFSVEQNRPNPFNPETSVEYSLPKPADVSFSVFNVIGQTVWNENFGYQPAGSYEVTWQGRNDRNESLPSGVYFYRLTAGENAITRKMLLLK